jgi:hypothetical protein
MKVLVVWDDRVLSLVSMARHSLKWVPESLLLDVYKASNNCSWTNNIWTLHTSSNLQKILAVRVVDVTWCITYSRKVAGMALTSFTASISTHILPCEGERLQSMPVAQIVLPRHKVSSGFSAWTAQLLANRLSQPTTQMDALRARETMWSQKNFTADERA